MKKTRIQALAKNIECKKISMKELELFLDEIPDYEFCIEICLGIPHETREELNYMLEYCYRRLHQSDAAAVSADLVTRLERQKRRLVTFCLLSDYKQFKYDEWNLFSSSPMPEVVSRIFSSGHYEDAFLLWRRHCGGIFILLTQFQMKS